VIKGCMGLGINSTRLLLGNVSVMF